MKGILRESECVCVYLRGTLNVSVRQYERVCVNLLVVVAVFAVDFEDRRHSHEDIPNDLRLSIKR